MGSYNKLVRDRIPEILDKKGVGYEKSTAMNDKEYKIALARKLIEESQEFWQVMSPEELADVIEVIEVLKKLPEYEEVEVTRQRKREERGGFDKRIILKGEYS